MLKIVYMSFGKVKNLFQKDTRVPCPLNKMLSSGGSLTSNTPLPVFFFEYHYTTYLTACLSKSYSDFIKVMK